MLSRTTRKNLVQRGHPQASLSLQYRLVGLCRSTLYYRPRAPDSDELALMRRPDKLHTAYPFYGSRQMSRYLLWEGYAAGRHRVRRLMRKMGLGTIHCKPRCSQPQPGHWIYPYLLRILSIEWPHQVRCADITYISLRKVTWT